MLRFNFAEVETGKDRTISELEKTLIGQFNFGIQAKSDQSFLNSSNLLRLTQKGQIALQSRA